MNNFHKKKIGNIGRCLGQTLQEVLQHIATHCNKLQHATPHCNTLQHTDCNILQHIATHIGRNSPRGAATHCNTLQHSAAHCSTQQRATAHCNTLHHTDCNILQHTATYCNTLQHTATRMRRCPGQPPQKVPQCVATHCNTLQHTATCCNTRWTMPWANSLRDIFPYKRVIYATGWQRPIGCLNFQVISPKRDTNYRAFLQEMTYQYQASYGSSPPCIKRALYIISRRNLQGGKDA